MTTIQGSSSSISPKISMREIDSLIAGALGLSFIFAPMVNRLLPQRYGARVHRTDATPATIGRDISCHPSNHPDCENCQAWDRCAEIQEDASE